MDDDLITMESYVDILRDEGYEVVFVQSVDKAIDVVTSDAHLDLIVVDLNLPPGEHFRAEWEKTGRLVGWLLRDLVRGRYPDVPLILLSNFTAALFGGERQSSTGEYLFSKRDFTPVELLSEVHSILARRVTPGP